MQKIQVCSSSVCLPENYNKMDLPPTSGPVIVNTTIILIDIFEVSPSLPIYHSEQNFHQYVSEGILQTCVWANNIILIHC